MRDESGEMSVECGFGKLSRQYVQLSTLVFQLSTLVFRLSTLVFRLSTHYRNSNGCFSSSELKN